MIRKAVVYVLDMAAFIVYGTFFAGCIVLVMLALAFRAKKRFWGGPVHRFAFVIFDPASDGYPSTPEETLLGGYIANDYLLYLDFESRRDDFKKIAHNIYFYAIAAHPDNGVYNAGFRKISSILTQLKILRTAVAIVRKNNISFLKSHDPH